MAQKIGRFDIIRLLGRGTQSAVYLAYDPHLEREVAIKTVHFAGRDAARSESLLREARTVSRLRHSNIVPIFEAGEQDGDPHLVFEYVEGRTLLQLVREEGALPAHRAAELMIQVLDAVDHAHRFSIVHRDLKPSNILINGEGVPRVMDFGIATKMDGGHRHNGAELQGTPAYMSPEYIASGIIGPQSDVYAAGLILYELVFGRRAIEAEEIFQTLHKIANEPLVFPAEPVIDERLRDIIAKATTKDCELRYESAEQMKKALEDYLKPEPEQPAAKGGQSTLEFLLRRMRHKTDFPALSEAISTINRLTASDRENVNTLSNSILKDFALTNKILRLVNSAYYRTAGGGSISTVSRAVVVLGVNSIRSIAISLILFEHLQNKQHAQLLKEEFLRANLSGILAKDLAGRVMASDGEEAFICALFHNLGRMLSQYYFPEEAEAIARLMAQDGCDEDTAAARVLGITYQDLGIGVARSWGFPEPLVHSMRRLPAGAVRAPGTREERMRVLAGFANQMCTVIESHVPEDRPKELEKLRARFNAAMPVTARQLHASLEESVTEIGEFSGIIHVNLGQTRIGRQIAQIVPAVLTQAADGKTAAADAPVPGTLTEVPTVLDEPPPLPDAGIAARQQADAGTPPAVDAQAVLASGIQDISNSLVEDFSLNDLLRIILETMYRAMGFRRVLMCVRDTRSNTMNGRFGFGADIDELAGRFRFGIGPAADIFNLVLAKGVDILISDAADPKIAQRIPDWYRKGVAAQTFIVFPLMIRHAPVAMIYADKQRAGDIAISEKELSLLRTLRNQAVLAIKQSNRPDEAPRAETSVPR